MATESHLDYDNLANAKLLANLVWYDGPLMNLYRADDDLYIAVWQDCTDTANIWLWLSVERELAILYLRGEVDLLTCFKKAEKMFVATVDGNDAIQWNKTCFSNLKESDLPESGSVLLDVADEHCDLTAWVNLLVAEREQGGLIDKGMGEI